MFRKRPPSNVVRFRRPRRKSWTRASDYGVEPARFAPPKRSWRRRAGGWLTGWRPFLLLVALITLYVLVRDGILPVPGLARPADEAVAARFTLCSEGGGANCVIDGDSLRVAGRTIRVNGVDAAEIMGKCDAERTLAKVQQAALLEWVSRGPFNLKAEWGEDRDKYGRELRDLERVREDGTRTTASGFLLSKGARPYAGEARQDWCG